MKHSYLLLLLLSACYPVGTETIQDMDVEGYTPVYGDHSRSKIKWMDAQQVENPGKIYIYGHYLLINEVKRGIHIYENADPANPQAIGFIEMIGNTDMAIKDNVLYADHLGSLVALKVEDFATLQELGRLPINNWLTGLPAPSGFHFECIDPSKGLVVAWKKQTLHNPDCYAN